MGENGRPLLLISAFANHEFSLGRFLPNHFIRILEPDVRNRRVRICVGCLWRNPVRYPAN
jgi:hypothetical protein